MIPNQWYVVLDSGQVRYLPVGVTRMGEKLVFWRYHAGRVSCLRDRCVHRGVALSEGKVLDRALLDKVKVELNRQYLALGKYNVTIKTKITPLERNRAAILIDIYEGQVSRIKQLNIVGNTVFSDETLLDEFNSGTRPATALPLLGSAKISTTGSSMTGSTIFSMIGAIRFSCPRCWVSVV